MSKTRTTLTLDALMAFDDPNCQRRWGADVDRYYMYNNTGDLVTTNRRAGESTESLQLRMVSALDTLDSTHKSGWRSFFRWLGGQTTKGDGNG